ncbi:MAG: SMC-Scp complex subunit ScpB [Gammaproteobacteria bacterium]|nr:SMC-Scp complex subunit ScpB [Gammaproteobacteria bacterium]
MDNSELKHIIEAALLAAGRPLSLDELRGLFGGERSAPPRQDVRAALMALQSDYDGRGLEVKEVASGYRIQVRAAMAPWLAKLWEERPPRYSRALMETLAIIAYRQPVTRGDVEEIRGVSVSTNIIRTLLERAWIRVVGHRDVPGKPEMFGTTREFLDYFGLKNLDQMPTLAELKDLDPVHVQLELPDVDEAAGELAASDAPDDNVTSIEDARAQTSESVSPEPAVDGQEEQATATVVPLKTR